MNSHSTRPLKNVGDGERWVSALTGVSLISLGLNQRSGAGALVALLGASLIKRGVTGECSIYRALAVSTADPKESGVRHEQGIRVTRSITIGRPPEELYAFFRDFNNLSKNLQHVESVVVLPNGNSHWKVLAPWGQFVEWDAEIINDKPNELLAWRSLPGADVDSAGSVSFRTAPGGRGTEISVNLSYQPPAGRLGAAVARLFGEEPGPQLEGDLRRIKQSFEAHEIPTIEGQPSGRGPDRDPHKKLVHSLRG